jgi:hypothetical protein
MDLISFGQNSFALRYGKYAEDLEYVSESGGQNWKTILPGGVAILCLIIGFLFVAKPKSDPTVPEKELTALQKVMKVFGFLLIFTALGGFGFYGYVYFTKYLPEYYEWFDSLPSEAKTELALVSFANKFLNNNSHQ